MLIRKARETDLDTIVAFNLALAEESEGLKLKEEVVRRGVRRMFSHAPACQYYLAEERGLVIGQTLLTTDVSDWRDGYYYWIHSVYVLPDWRGKGVFRRLFDEVVAYARAHEGRSVRLYVDKTNQKAAKTYEALGMSSAHYLMYELEP